MIKTKLAAYLFEDDSEQSLDEFNAMGTGMVVGYQAPLGAHGVGSSSPLEKAFWRDNSGKEVKTGSPALHHKKSRRKKIKETISLLEGPYGEYPEIGAFIDFKIEKIKDIQGTHQEVKEKKEQITRKFNTNKIDFLCKVGEKYYVCGMDSMREATEEDKESAKTIEDIDFLSAEKQILKLDNEILISESFGAMHKPDFSGEAMRGLWDSLKDVENSDQPVKTASPLLHVNKKDAKINESIIAGSAFLGSPKYNSELQNHGFWRHRKNHDIKTKSVALTKNKRNPKGHRHDLIEDEIHLAESIPILKKAKDPIPNIWTGLPDVSNFEQKIKTSSPNLRRRVRRGERR